MASGAELTLTARDLAVDRGGREVFSDVSFVVRGGEALQVVGPNGAGKSTLLRALAGLLSPARGSIELSGAELPEAAHLVGHLNALKLQFTALENIRFWAQWQGGRGALQRAEEALEAVDLGPLADTPAQFLSQGQRRRLGLARPIASARPIWLLDEPVVGLDTASRQAFGQVMSRHLQTGGLIVASTHDPLGLDAVSELAL
ncbi:MAG: heme ABC exporter ATP-binding protein CcmA [Pseudomonadota bacterium]